MKRFVSFHFLFAIFFSACLFLNSCSDREEPTATVPEARGKVLSVELKESFNVEQVAAYMNSYSPIVASLFPPQHPVDLYKVVYETLDADDNITIASGIIAVPVGLNSNLPLASYQHGTIFSKDGAPSNGSTEQLIAIGMASNGGYVTQIADYIGLGVSPGLHPYHHARTEATAVIDMLRAARQVCADKDIPLSDDLFLFGYSQGGHATMAVHQYIETYYSDEFTVTGSAPMEGAYDISGTQTDILLSGEPYPAPYYLPYLLISYNNVYKMYPTLADALREDWYNLLAPMLSDNVTYSDGNIDAVMPDIPIEIIKPEVLTAFQTDPEHPLRKALYDNDTYRWIPKSKMRLFHCDADKHVDFGNAQVAYDYFQEQGATNVELVMPLAGGTHETCVIVCLVQGKAWFDELRQ